MEHRDILCIPLCKVLYSVVQNLGDGLVFYLFSMCCMIDMIRYMVKLVRTCKSYGLSSAFAHSLSLKFILSFCVFILFECLGLVSLFVHHSDPLPTKWDKVYMLFGSSFYIWFILPFVINKSNHQQKDVEEGLIDKYSFVLILSFKEKKLRKHQLMVMTIQSLLKPSIVEKRILLRWTYRILFLRIKISTSSHYKNA